MGYKYSIVLVNGEGEGNEENMVFCIYLWNGDPIDDHGIAFLCPEISQNTHASL
jgi:hypothetical protein